MPWIGALPRGETDTVLKGSHVPDYRASLLLFGEKTDKPSCGVCPDQIRKTPMTVTVMAGSLEQCGNNNDPRRLDAIKRKRGEVKVCICHLRSTVLHDVVELPTILTIFHLPGLLRR